VVDRLHLPDGDLPTLPLHSLRGLQLDDHCDGCVWLSNLALLNLVFVKGWQDRGQLERQRAER